MQNLKEIKIGCIGCGTMGSSLIKSMLKVCSNENIFISTKHPENAKKIASENKINACDSNLDLAQKADYIFLAVKPAYICEVLSQIESALNGKIIISMAAGININTLSKSFNALPKALIRIMPNLPATVGEAMTALCTECDDKEIIETVKTLLSTAGRVEQVEEKLMDGVTAISGSGPAYGFLFIEALADAAVKFGIPRKQAYVYAAQTLKGAASMALEDERSISQLKDAVCSPGGTTIEGVISLEKNGFRGTVIDCAEAVYKRSVELGKK